MVTDTLLEPPETDRPRMFGQAGLVPVLLPWSWAEHRLAAARHYWIATTRPDGRPHSRPVWGVWRDGALFFSTGSLAVRNLADNPRITVHLESGSEVVILEGRATSVGGPETLRRAVTEYNEKYGWDADPADIVSWYVMRPDVAFGWVSDETGLDQGAAFHGTTTRWRFPSR
jgi:hypothetical protein